MRVLQHLDKKPNLHIMEQAYFTLSMLGTLQGVLLAILLFTRKHTRKANLILGTFVLLLSFSLAEPVYQPIVPVYMRELIGGLVFLYGPCMLIYLHLLFESPPSKSSVFKHFLLLGLYVLALAVNYFITEIDKDIAGVIASLVFFVQLFIYCFLSLRRIQTESNKTETTLTHSTLTWLRWIVGGLSGIYVLAFCATCLLLLVISTSSWIVTTVQIGCVIVVYSLSYWSLMQADVRQQNETIKYQTSSLLEPDKEILLTQILAFIDEHKPYLKPTLTLDEFAKDFGVNRFYISQVINERTRKNFSDFINTYRIEEAKRILMDTKKSHYSVVGAGYEAGFNSKTTFNTVFKKLTGCTPTAYRKLQQQEVRIEQTEQ